MEVVRRWINEGAKPDKVVTKTYRLTRRNVAVHMDKITRIFCRVNTQAYLVVSARDPRTGRTLWSDVASLKTPREGVDAGEPGQVISWDIRAGEQWPALVTIELKVEHAMRVPEARGCTRNPG